MSRREEIALLQKIMDHRDMLRVAVKSGDTLAKSVVQAYGIWYDHPDNPRAFHQLAAKMDQFIEAQRQTVLA